MILQPVRRQFLIILLTFLIGSLSYLSMDIFLPSLPAVHRAFETSTALTQLTVSLYVFGLAFSQLFYGYATERQGRRRVLSLGMSIYCLASLLCMVAPNIDLLLLGRLLQGCGAGAGALLSRVMVRDLYSGKKLSKTASHYNTAVTAFIMLAPVIGGFTQQYFGFRMVFCLLLVLAALALILLVFIEETLPLEKRQPKSFRQTVTIYGKLLGHPQFLSNTVCAGIAISALVSFLSFNTFLVQVNLGYSASNYGLVALVISAFEVLASIGNTLLLNYVSGRNLLATGTAVLALSGLFLLFSLEWVSLSLVLLLVTGLIFSTGLSLIVSNASANALAAFQSGFGPVAALYGFIQMSLTASSSFVVSRMAVNDPKHLAALLMILGSLGLLAWGWGRRAQNSLAS